MFNRLTTVPAAGTSSTLPTTSRRAFGRLGLSAAGLALAGCSASEPSADSALAEAAVDQGFVPAQDAASQAAVTPDAALTLLTDGNARFVAGTPVSRDYSDQIRATVLYQFALVIQCSGSNLAEPSLRLGAISEQLAEPRSLYEDASGPLADLDERTAALFIRVPIKMLMTAATLLMCISTPAARQAAQRRAGRRHQEPVRVRQGRVRRHDVDPGRARPPAGAGTHTPPGSVH